MAARKHGAGEACGENHARGVSRPALKIAVRFIAGQAANLGRERSRDSFVRTLPALASLAE